MKIREPMLLLWGLVLVGGAVWVRFGIGSESWTNWMMGGFGVLILILSLIWPQRKNT